MHKFHIEQKIKILNKDRLRPCTCMTLCHVPYPNPGPGPNKLLFIKTIGWTSLVAQWLRIHLPMQGTRVRALVQEDPTCCGATKPVCHNY